MRCGSKFSRKNALSVWHDNNHGSKTLLTLNAVNYFASFRNSQAFRADAKKFDDRDDTVGTEFRLVLFVCVCFPFNVRQTFMLGVWKLNHKMDFFF